MASRQEEKERRRQERLAADREAAEREARGKRLRIFGGVALLVLALAAVGIALASSGGGSSDGNAPAHKSGSKASIPSRKISNLNAAARAAGCTLKNFPASYEDRGHVPDSTKLKFKTNPPVFGKHFEIPAKDGDYVGQGSPRPGNWIHALEHGRIEYQYRPGLPTKQQQQLESLFDEDSDLVLVLQNNTGMKADVAALAWTHQALCPKMNDKVFDVLRAFRDQYKLKGPEVIPTPE
jgi:hypothetical protein